MSNEKVLTFINILKASLISLIVTIIPFEKLLGIPPLEIAGGSIPKN